MRKFQYLLFVLKRSYICYYIISMTVPLRVSEMAVYHKIDVLALTISGAALRSTIIRKFRYDARNQSRNTPCDIFVYSYIQDKAFKNGSSKTCGRQPLKNFTCSILGPCNHLVRKTSSFLVPLGVSKTRQVWKNFLRYVTKKCIRFINELKVDQKQPFTNSLNSRGLF